MSSTDVYETFLRMVERYGFGIVLATAILWFVRTDLVLPMVAAHQQFLREMASTQKEIGRAISEQTHLLYQMQPAAKQQSYTSSISGLPETTN